MKVKLDATINVCEYAFGGFSVLSKFLKCTPVESGGWAYCFFFFGKVRVSLSCLVTRIAFVSGFRSRARCDLI